MVSDTLMTVREICAVSLFDREHAKGPIAYIPARQLVRSHGAAAAQGMIEIEWLQRRYAVFEVDLLERAVTIDDT